MVLTHGHLPTVARPMDPLVVAQSRAPKRSWVETQVGATQPRLVDDKVWSMVATINNDIF
jgi:hypothetical protein